MISKMAFKRAKEIYENAQMYVEQKEISDELKKDLAYILEKYRFYFTMMEEDEVLEDL